MANQTRSITAEEFLFWPDEPGFRQELFRGAVVTKPLHGARHGEVASEIGGTIGNYVSTHRFGETYATGTGFIVERDPDTVLGPDVSFVASQKMALIIDEERHMPFAPDLVVEVLECVDGEVESRTQLWLTAGSRLGWNVDPEDRTVVVHRPGAEPIILHENDEIDGGDVILGFRCRVADFFA